MKAAFNYNRPEEIVLSRSSSSVENTDVVARTTNGSACSLAGMTDNNALTLYVWARYAGSGSNYTTVYGWHMPKS